MELKFLEKVKVLENVRSGYVGLNVGHLISSGVAGDYWSSWSAQAATGAYTLPFNASDVVPSNVVNRWVAFPLRCLAD